MRRLNKTAPAAETKPTGGAMSRYGDTPTDVVEEMPGFAYMGFYGPKKGAAQAITEGIGKGALVNGHPFICVNGDYIDAADTPFTVLDGLQYWARFQSGTYEMEAAWLEKPAGNFRTQGIRQCFLGLLLHVPPGGEPFATVSDLQGVKEPCGSEHVRAIEESQTAEFARANGDLVAKAPPAFRVFSTIVNKPSGPRAKFPYVTAHAAPAPTTAEQWEALVRWDGDSEAQAILEQAEAAYARKAGYIKSLV